MEITEPENTLSGFSNDEWTELLRQLGNSCALCGSDEAIVPSRVVPRKLGGQATIDNIQPLCSRCVAAKREHVADYRPFVSSTTAQAISTQSGRVSARRTAGIVGTKHRGRVPKMLTQRHLLAIEHVHLHVKRGRIEDPILENDVELLLIEEIKRLRALIVENLPFARMESQAWRVRYADLTAIESRRRMSTPLDSLFDGEEGRSGRGRSTDGLRSSARIGRCRSGLVGSKKYEMTLEDQESTYRAAVRKAAQHSQRVISKGDERGSFTADEWLSLCEQYSNRCVLCSYERPLTPDHVVPLAKGGPNTIDNIQPTCRPCNMAKYKSAVDYRVYELPRSRGGPSAVGTYTPAPKPIWREHLLEVEQYLQEAHNPNLSRSERARSERRWRYIPFSREELVPALVWEIRRLRKLVLENEALVQVESVAWWSRGSLPSALEAYYKALESGLGEDEAQVVQAAQALQE
ncbi:MAG: HNH endonuclease [Chloroflexota bacterium]|nr:HNH endonuclease [Chloroflexota bacterium]